MTRRARAAATAAASVLLSGLATAAQAATVQVPIGSATTRVIGATANDHLGDAVQITGDVSGDGRMDYVVGAPYADNLSRRDSGSVYVVYGRSQPYTLNLRTMTSAQGFRIDGPSAGALAGTGVSASDINSDGRFDVVVGAPGADSRGRVDNGSVFVIFGRASSSNVNLASLGTRGFRIDGARSRDRAGQSVTVAGLINADPRDDILVGAPGEDPNGVSGAGAAHVVFGKTSTGAVDLRTLGTLGYSIVGTEALGAVGSSVAGLGDMNGDGRGDMAIGAPGVTGVGSATTPAGAVWGVWGKLGTARITLAGQSRSYFQVAGGAQNDRLGISVAGLGDVNTDGLADMIMGTYSHGPEPGYVPVLFGLPYEGYANSRSLPGYHIVPQYSESVAGLGHVGGSFAPDTAAGRYVVYGRETQTPVDVGDLGPGGFAVADSATEFVRAVRAGGAPDYDGDGHGDLFVQVRRSDDVYALYLLPVT